MNLEHIPTPETDAAWNHPDPSNYGELALVMREKSNDLERRLTVEKTRAEEMGKLARTNACESEELRGMLTVAREALEIAKVGICAVGVPNAAEREVLNDAFDHVCKALTQTAPKP